MYLFFSHYDCSSLELPVCSVVKHVILIWIFVEWKGQQLCFTLRKVTFTNPIQKSTPTPKPHLMSMLKPSTALPIQYQKALSSPIMCHVLSYFNQITLHGAWNTSYSHLMAGTSSSRKALRELDVPAIKWEYECDSRNPNKGHGGAEFWKHFPCYWPFVRVIHRCIPLTKGGEAEYSCFPSWTGWANNRYAGDAHIMTSL